MYPISKDIIESIVGGDELSFRTFFDYYWDTIYSVAFTFTKSESLSEEIVQEVFVKVWLKREQLALVTDMDAWLFIIARNHILNVLQKKVKEEAFLKNLEGYFSIINGSPEDLLFKKEAEALVNSAVTQLPKQQQLIYTLSRIAGLSQEEIAAKLNISKNTVKSHMNKALNAIRIHIESNSAGISLIYAVITAFLTK